MIKDPLQHTDAAGFIDPATGLPYTTNQDLTPTVGTGSLYGTQFYDLRQTDLSNLPEDIHEAKAGLTWMLASNLSATVAYRVRLEENSLDRSDWEQFSHSPSASPWFAPSDEPTLTFLYN